MIRVLAPAGLERAAQAEHALACAHVSDPGLARGEHDPFRRGEIERGDLLSREDAIVDSGRRVRPVVRAGEEMLLEVVGLDSKNPR